MTFINFSCFNTQEVKIKRTQISKPIPGNAEATRNPWADEVQAIRAAMGADIPLIPTTAPVPAAVGSPKPLCCKKKPWRPALPILDYSPPAYSAEDAADKATEQNDETQLPERTSAVRNFSRPFASPPAPGKDMAAHQTDIETAILTGAILGSTQHDCEVSPSTRQARRRAHTVGAIETPATSVMQHSDMRRATIFGGADAAMGEARRLLHKVHNLAARLLEVSSEDSSDINTLFSTTDVLTRAQRAAFVNWRLLKSVCFDADMVHVRDAELLPDLVMLLKAMETQLVPPKIDEEEADSTARYLSINVKMLFQLGSRLMLLTEAKEPVRRDEVERLAGVKTRFEQQAMKVETKVDGRLWAMQKDSW